MLHRGSLLRDQPTVCDFRMKVCAACPGMMALQLGDGNILAVVALGLSTHGYYPLVMAFKRDFRRAAMMWTLYTETSLEVNGTRS